MYAISSLSKLTTYTMGHPLHLINGTLSEGIGDNLERYQFHMEMAAECVCITQVHETTRFSAFGGIGELSLLYFRDCVRVKHSRPWSYHGSLAGGPKTCL